MADGSIEFSTTLDNSDLEKKLQEAEKRIDDLKRKIESKETERNGIAEQMKQATDEIDRARQSIEKLKAKREELKASDTPQARGQIAAITAEIDSELKSWEKQNAVVDKLNTKVASLDNQIDGYTESLKTAETEYGKLGAEAQRQAARSNGVFSRASSGIKSTMASTASNVKNSFMAIPQAIQSPFDTLEKKLFASLKKVFVFSMIVKGVKALKKEITSMMGENEQFNASVENLKATMRGFLSQVVSAVLPVFMSIVNALAGIFQRIASIIDAIFGTNIVGAIQSQRDQASAEIQANNAKKQAEYANQVAQAEQKQAKAANKLAKAQEKANRQIMSFDELNTLAADSSEDMTDAMEDYASEIEAPELETDWTQTLLPDAGLLNGILDWLDMLKDRILTDVEGPFARIREGLQLIKQGWDEIITGIQTGNWALVWQGVVDIVTGALYVIEGAFGAFMDWLNEVTGGQFSDVFEGLKNTVHGFVEFVEGVLRGDLQLALQGLNDFVDGLAQTLHGLLKAATEGLLNLVNFIAEASTSKWNELFDALENRFPQFKGALEVLRNFVLGIGDVIYNSIVGVINGLSTFIHGAIDGIANIFKGLFDLIVGLFTGNTDLLASGFRMMVNGVLQLLESAINGILTGAAGVINGIISMVNRIPGVNFSTYTPSYASLPRLATGAVIPPNREFLAVLGDQTSGMNVEAPEDLIRQIVREESGGGADMQSAITNGMVAALMQLMPMMQSSFGGDVIAQLELDGDTVARQINARNQDFARRGLVNPQYGY